MSLILKQNLVITIHLYNNNPKNIGFIEQWSSLYNQVWLFVKHWSHPSILYRQPSLFADFFISEFCIRCPK